MAKLTSKSTSFSGSTKKDIGYIATATAIATFVMFHPITDTIAKKKGKEKTVEIQKKNPNMQKQKTEEKSIFASEKLPSVLKDVKGSTDEEKVASLFSILKIGNGVLRLEDSRWDERAPRDVDSTLEKGGDCTEFAFVIISALKQLGIKGGALIIHFEGSEKEKDHLVAYALINNKKIYIDPQADGLGKTKGKYAVLMELTFEEAEGIYYRELGNHLRLKGMLDDAIVAFEKAVKFNPKDAYCHNALGNLYEKKGAAKRAREHYELAAEYDPNNKTYQKNRTVSIYNEELKAAYEAFEKGDYKSAKEHFENALNSGEKLSEKERKALKNNISACEQMLSK